MFQQNLPKFDMAVIVLAAKTNRLDDLVVLLPKILESIPSAEPGGPLVLESERGLHALSVERDARNTQSPWKA